MIFFGILAVLCGISGECAVIVIRKRARAVEVIVRIGRHGIDLSRCGVHDDATGTRFATGFDRRFLEIFFEIALDFVINGRDKICSRFGRLCRFHNYTAWSRPFRFSRRGFFRRFRIGKYRTGIPSRKGLRRFRRSRLHERRAYQRDRRGLSFQRDGWRRGRCR